MSCMPYRRGMMHRRTTITTWLISGTLVLCANFFAQGASGQIAKVVDDAGRSFFVNAEPPRSLKLNATRPRTNIYLPAESTFAGRNRPAVDIGRDGVEKIVREASDRHRVDPALVRAVIETESNWNPKAYSHKGAGGFFFLQAKDGIRDGAYDVFDPQQNIDAGVRHLKMLLQRYNGNLDLALAAYNAGEGAVDKAQGIPPFRETRDYVQKVQNAYFRPGSGRLADAFINRRAIHRDVAPDGRIIFSNE